MSAQRVGWLAALALFACGEPASEHSVHDHVHEDEEGHHDHNHGDVVSITAWSDTLELFAEHPPGRVGRSLPFFAHLTHMEDFRALEGATARLTLEGPASLSVEATMLRAGIYEFELTPRAPGTYRGRVDIVSGGEGTVDGFDVVVTEGEPAEESHAHEDEHGHDHEEHESESDEPITLLKEQQWRVPFATALAARGRVAPGYEVAGEIAAPPGGRAHVHSPVAGRVLGAAGGFPLPGQRVEAGALLATLAPTPGAPEAATQSASQVVDAEVQLEDARAALARAERLLADQAVPERQVEEARRRVRAGEASLSAARRSRALYSAASRGAGRGTWRIAAPIAGVIDEVHVSPGEAVEANELLFRVIDPSERWLTAFVPEAWATRVRPQGEVTFHLIGEEGVRRVDGELVDVSRAVDDHTRTVRAIWTLPEPPPELRLGASVRVNIPSGEPEEGLVVARGAIVAVEGRSVLYVQRAAETFEERVVRTGAEDGARVVVLEGLEEGERVVTVGAYMLRLASTAGEAGGHAHGHPH